MYARGAAPLAGPRHDGLSPVAGGEGQERRRRRRKERKGRWFARKRPGRGWKGLQLPRGREETRSFQGAHRAGQERTLPCQGGPGPRRRTCPSRLKRPGARTEPSLAGRGGSAATFFRQGPEPVLPGPGPRLTSGPRPA